jgi:hypothetical protein
VQICQAQKDGEIAQFIVASRQALPRAVFAMNTVDCLLAPLKVLQDRVRVFGDCPLDVFGGIWYFGAARYPGIFAPCFGYICFPVLYDPEVPDPGKCSAESALGCLFASPVGIDLTHSIQKLFQPEAPWASKHFRSEQLAPTPSSFDPPEQRFHDAPYIA